MAERGRTESGDHERRLATSSLAQQASQLVAAVTALITITFLARRLPLPEFGAYGLLVSLTAYVSFIQSSVETASVKALAAAPGPAARTRAYSTALSLYIAAGLAAAALLAGPGSALLGVFHTAPGLHREAQLSIFALAVVTGLGWPLKVFQDVLRGSQRIDLSASAEIVAYVTLCALLVTLVVVSAPLWLLVAVGASTQMLVGAASAVVVVSARLQVPFRREEVTTAGVRGFLGLSAYLSLIGVSSIVIYALDRTILAAFRSATTVGLYEGPVRAHNLVQQVHGALYVPVLPAASRYLAEGDTRRAHDLLLRGTRYSLALVVPLAIVLMVLARPILRTWLGAQFGVAATAMTILVSYWLLNASTGVAGGMLVAAGRVRMLAVYAVGVALGNLALSLALTPWLGLNGVVLGTAIAYVAGFPFFLAIALIALPIKLSDLAREAWLPAYLTGAVVAALLVAIRLTVALDRLPEVTAAAVGAVLAYWLAYYVVWLRPSERLLVRDVARSVLRSRPRRR